MTTIKLNTTKFADMIEYMSDVDLDPTEKMDVLEWIDAEKENFDDCLEMGEIEGLIESFKAIVEALAYLNKLEN